MAHDRTVDLVAGIGIAGTLLLLAWVTLVAAEDRVPSTNRFYAGMRSRNGRRIIAALVAVMALIVLVIHILKFAAE